MNTFNILAQKINKKRIFAKTNCMQTPVYVQQDPYLLPFEAIIRKRMQQAYDKEAALTEKKQLTDFANGHLYFGLHKTDKEWILREWAPNAKKIYLIGTFNNWAASEDFAFKKLKNGVWEICLPKETIKHGDLYKLLMLWNGGKGERIPAYCTRSVQDEKTKIFSAQVWLPEQAYKWRNSSPVRPCWMPLIYEAHIGMATEKEKVGTYVEFRKNVLPHVIKCGYNVLQLMAIQEHPYYGSFGYHVSNFFAASSRFGTPEELKELIDEAHGAGLYVIMDLVHSHAVKNEVEGLAKQDGTAYQYFHDGERGNHPAWDSKCFNYGKNEVLHFLLSNCKYWMEEYHFDGFRFDGITSMLHLHHGLSIDFTSYQQYYDNQQDEDAITYLYLANKLIHQINKNAITIAEEMSGMPGVAARIEDGGIGFNYRLAMGVPDYWIKIIKERKDEEWQVGELFYQLSSRRNDEKTISYAESHDQALVGDQTIFFRLVERKIYDAMHLNITDLAIDRGIALHKMIRMATIATAGHGYLNFMGNEFGHPEWIDFPSEQNNWSYKYARRQWNLIKNKDLKFQFLLNFDIDLISFVKKEALLLENKINVLKQDDYRQVLAFERGGLIFVFNFSPTQSYTNFLINVPKGNYKIKLNTDDKKYFGHERINTQMNYPTIISGGISQFSIYIPSQTGLAFANLTPAY